MEKKTEIGSNGKNKLGFLYQNVEKKDEIESANSTVVVTARERGDAGRRRNFTRLTGGGLQVGPTVAGRTYVVSTTLKELESFVVGSDRIVGVVGGGSGWMEAEGLAGWRWIEDAVG